MTLDPEILIRLLCDGDLRARMEALREAAMGQTVEQLVRMAASSPA